MNGESMIIERLALTNFRNYKELEIRFDPQLNIIYGNNAQGKTNILEAMYVCATSRSHRTSVFKEMINMGEVDAHINLGIRKEDYSYEIDVHLKKNNKKSIAINKLPIKKLDELLGVLHVIMFSPEDLSLIKSGPKERRRFIDIELSQLNSFYYHYLHQFSNILKQRNALLKLCQIKGSPENIEQLAIWDIQFIHYGKKVIELRESFIIELNTIYKKRHYEISGGYESIDLKYDKNVNLEDFEEKLVKNRSKDIKFGSTSVGPHRDDLLFDLDGVDLRKYGSQGQQRTAALSLKLSEIEMAIEKTGQTPILLLDDVLSELDANRQIYLMEHLENVQTFITCTGVEDFIKQGKTERTFFKVIGGEIA